MTPVHFFEEMRLPLELSGALLIYILPFGKKKDHFLMRVCTVILFAAVFSLLYFPIFGAKDAPRFYYGIAFWYPLVALTSVALAKVCFEIGWCDTLLLSVQAFVTQNLVYVILHEIIAVSLFPQLREHLLLYILSSVLISALLYVPLYLIFRKPLTMAGPALFKDTLSAILFYALLFVLTVACIFYYQSIFSITQKGALGGSLLIEFTFCVFVLIIQYSLIRSRSLSVQNEVLEQALRDSGRYYEMSKETVAIINRKCHDFKHQLKVLSMVSEEERNQYIKEAMDNILFYQHLVHSSNPVINTILAEKGLFCEEKDILLSCSVDDVPLDFISVTDLYAILGNAIDNAIECVSAYTDAEQRVINFSISQRRGFVSIQINNPYYGKALSAQSLPVSTKGDTANHGFGLRSIKYLTEKYQGHMELSTDDELFTLQLVIPLFQQ